MATIKDLVRITKISKSTISRALRDPKSVSPNKLATINEAIKEVGYIPNYFASNLKSKNSHTIAFLINETQNIFFNKIIYTIQNNFEKEGYKLIVSYGTDGSNDFAENIKHLISLSPAALIFSPNYYDKDVEAMFSSTKIFPFQIFSDTFENFNSLTIDDFKGTYLATKRLIASKLNKILLIGFEGHVFQNRLKGYKKALEENGIEFNEKLIISLSTKERITDVIMSNILSANPDGIIAISNTIGLETQKVLSKMGKSIPNDISMIQYDDSLTAELMNITVIGHTFDSLGKMIVSNILKGIQNDSKVIEKLTIEPILIERDSIKGF